jgi:hypothetical protein
MKLLRRLANTIFPPDRDEISLVALAAIAAIGSVGIASLCLWFVHAPP